MDVGGKFTPSIHYNLMYWECKWDFSLVLCTIILCLINKPITYVICFVTETSYHKILLINDQ